MKFSGILRAVVPIRFAARSLGVDLKRARLGFLNQLRDGTTYRYFCGPGECLFTAVGCREALKREGLSALDRRAIGQVRDQVVPWIEPRPITRRGGQRALLHLEEVALAAAGVQNVFLSVAAQRARDVLEAEIAAKGNGAGK